VGSGWLRANGITALERLSEPAGGRAFEVSRKMPLERILREIGEEMRHQYGLGFTPPAGGKEGAFHKLEVKCARPGLKARAGSGYWAGRPPG
jgi:VWFA-related protein